MPLKVLPGSRNPLGSAWDGKGVNFALYSENATAVELCIFDPNDPTKEIERVRVRAAVRAEVERRRILWIDAQRAGQHGAEA